MIKSGDVIQSPKWPEPVAVKLVEVVGDGAYYRIVGARQPSQIHVDDLIPTSELDLLRLARVDTGFAADPRQVFLSLEALRYRFAALYDPLLAMNTSKVDPLPHQIEAVYGYILQLPRIRFLIADDPGAGKTIMAGLVIKELKLRKQASRILIVAPGHLKDQWRRELRERFEESFTSVDRGLMDSTYGENVWARESQLITSIDFAKQDDVMASLSTTHFDLVIVDEAHKLAAYRYGAHLEKTIRYKLGEMLAANSTHLLFLTATPHRGDPENFRLFLDLLEPGFFATTEMVAESIREQDNPLFIRRIKEDLKSFDGEPLFLPRHVDTKSFDLGVESPAEKNLYNDLSQYVREQYNKALTREDKRRNIFFALVILQRRLASSTYALLQSLDRRHKRLRDILDGATTRRATIQSQGAIYDIEEADDLSEEERWQREEMWETLSVAENRYELEREIETLEGLIKQARAIINSGSEVKLRHLQEALGELNKKQPGAQILIFTESRDTLDYLQRRIKEWGYTVTAIHGGMKMEERIAAEATFRNEAQVMVATEAAGEGINLQFCNLMINYDIPWTPTRLEQRMGRIHRYGQNREVFIFNLVAVDTREGMVLHRLFDKLREIENALGSDKVFDVLGAILQGKNLAELLVEAASSARSVEEILAELDIQVDQNYVNRVRENLGESLATRYIDYTRIKEMADQAREHRLIPEYTEAFFKKAMEAVGGRIRVRGNTGALTHARHLLTIDSLPASVRQIADESDFRKRYGPVLRQYSMVTFDKEVAQRTPKAEFISFGHPLFEAMLVWVERNLASTLLQGAVFSDPDGRLDGLLLFYEGDIQDGLGQVTGRRLFALYYDLATADITTANPAILWDLEEGGLNPPMLDLDIESVKRQAWATLLPMLEEYKGELGMERHRQARIKEKYGVASLDHLILKLDGELIDLYTRQERGENVDLATRMKEDQMRRYQQALGDLKNNVERERSLTITTPRFVGIVRVVPKQVVNEELVDDPNVERIGMQISMQHERDYHRTPEDVAKQNLGFDVRSVDFQGRKRYIEVKARTGEWSVQLTQNEWFKAQRFGEDYYLYVVLNAVSEPKLYILQNPAAILRPLEQIEVRYVVSVGDIKTQGEEA